MLKKIILIPLVATPVVAVSVIVPAVIFASKNQVNNSTSGTGIGSNGTGIGSNVTEYFETKENIGASKASILGLPNTKEALKEFVTNSNSGKSWVINKKDTLFIGTTKFLTSSSQVNNIVVVELPNTNVVTLFIELKEGSYVDGFQQVSSAPKTFQFQITID